MKYPRGQMVFGFIAIFRIRLTKSATYQSQRETGGILKIQ